MDLNKAMNKLEKIRDSASKHASDNRVYTVIDNCIFDLANLKHIMDTEAIEKASEKEWEKVYAETRSYDE